MNDLIQRFIFDQTDIRGELVRLDQTYSDTLAAHQYQPAVARLLGEFLAAAALLSATLKFAGTLTLQARSEGQLPLIMAESSSDHKLRAIASGADHANSEDFHTLLTNGQLAITIQPHKGQRYQGIVALEGDSLAECLQAYFRQSEQLSTRIWLHSSNEKCAGLMLQELPDSHIDDQRDISWEHVTQLADTLSNEELLTLDFEQLLYRLYHQEPLRLFDPAAVAFQCSCSEQRTLSAIRALGKQELMDILAEQGAIDINCEFCHQHYHFDQVAIEKLLHDTLH